MPPHCLTSSRGKSRLLFPACLILSGFASYQLASWASQPGMPRLNVSSKAEVSARTPLVPSPAKLDLCTLYKGGTVSATFWLQNSTDRTIEIGEIKTSCECLEVSLARKQIFAGERTIAHAKVDLSDQPTFVGKLRLEASGFVKTEGGLKASGFSDDQAACIFLVYVDTEVSP